MANISQQLIDNGYAIFTPNKFVDTRNLLTECQKPTVSISQKKSFLGSLMVSPAIRAEVNKLSIEQNLLEYLGPGTKLQSVEMYHSTPNNSTYRSGQLWHKDIDFIPQIKMFFMCQPTMHDNGPFTFLSSQDSDIAHTTLNYIMGKCLGDNYFQSYVPIELTGDAGSLVFIDTSRCFHFGSRCKAGERIALVVQFVQ